MVVPNTATTISSVSRFQAMSGCSVRVSTWPQSSPSTATTPT